ncbi:MAG: methyltransferase family protein [Streptomyces sp.]|uniref:methyltransferase family protein n=1 Tax=Streptomyces sp. TaxID=1931 RepID=UPI003D6A23CC
MFGTLGAVSMTIGLTLLVWTIALFDRVGDGTLAPWDAPKKLVVRGPYLHVRNPMISGVLFILPGETLLFRSTVLLVWLVGFFAINQTYIPLLEERGLERRFGQDYVTYKHHVRRWLPRFRPWHALGVQTPEFRTPTECWRRWWCSRWSAASCGWRSS